MENYWHYIRQFEYKRKDIICIYNNNDNMNICVCAIYALDTRHLSIL